MFSKERLQNEGHEMKILFLSFTLPKEIMDHICRTDLYPPVATDKHQWNIITGLEAASRTSIDLMSVHPVTNYPYSPYRMIKYEKWSHKDGRNDVIAPFVNIIILKQMTQICSLLFLICRWLYRNRSVKDKKIVINTVHSPFIYSTLFATRLFGGDPVLIITDLPMGASSPRNPLKRLLKSLNDSIVICAIRKMKGLIVLTEQIARDYFPAIPSIVVEGITSGQDGWEQLKSSPPKNDRVILYAGLLRREYGLKFLIDAFRLIPDQSYRLWIFGRGEMEDEIKQAALNDPRIFYGGFLPKQEILGRMQQATVLVNPRPSNQQFTAYSFPSKLLEYMSIGTPVLSTALSGIPREYNEYIYLLKDETPAAMAEILSRICSMSGDELRHKGLRAREFVLRNKNFIRQGARMYAFLKSL